MIFGINTTIDVISRVVRRETIWVEYAKYHVQIMLLFVYAYYPQKFCNFHMHEFQIKLKYHWSKPIKLQKFLMYWYKPGRINATAAGCKITYLKCFILTHVTVLRLEGIWTSASFWLWPFYLATRRSRFVTMFWYYLQTQETHWNNIKTLNIWFSFIQNDRTTSP